MRNSAGGNLNDKSNGSSSYRPDEVPIVELRHLNKTFGGVRALNNVNFNVFLGEVVAVVGDNGAGKSTLIKVISGLQPADSGEFWFDGRSVKVQRPADAFALGIQTVYQDLALCDNMDVSQNLFLGREEVSSPVGLRLDRTLMEQRADRVLRQHGTTNVTSLRRPVGKLSGGQRQMVSISRSVLWEPKVVVLDEPTAALGVVQRRHVAELIMRLRAEKRGVVVVSQSVQDVIKIADRIIVLRLGQKVAEFVGEVNPSHVLGAITGVYRQENLERM